MHPLEAKKSHIGTGRMAHVALKNSEIIVDNDFDDNPRFNTLLSSPEFFPILLYPGIDSINVNEDTIDHKEFKGKTPLIFILDGTWPCAKTMMKNTKKLHDLPKMSFSISKVSKFAIKHQPAKYCLSTIESIYYLLEGLEEQKLEDIGTVKETLLTALAATVEFHKKCASDPTMNNYTRDSKGPKPIKERVDSIKWKTRNICYKP
jgi:DTW domain-containing protein YfiP